MAIANPKQAPTYKIITLTYETLGEKKKTAYWNKDEQMWMYTKDEATIYGDQRKTLESGIVIPALPDAETIQKLPDPAKGKINTEICKEAYL